MERKTSCIFFILFLLLAIQGCNYNPLSHNNDLTGSPAGSVVGAGAGVGAATFLHAPGPMVAATGLLGATVGYYVTTLRFSAGGIYHAGGQVFALGDFVTIELPSDHLFDPATADLLPTAAPALDSAINVLQRFSGDNIIVSGNTAGFGTDREEQRLSEQRAREVAAYLWANGVTQFQEGSLRTRKLTYVGYGDYFPIANHLRSASIRQNSRIQITAYPSKSQLAMDKHQKALNNIGDIDEPHLKTPVATEDFNREFPIEPLPEGNSGSRASDFKGSLVENNTAGAYSSSLPNYNSVSNSPHTTVGERVSKQGGVKDFKGEGDFKEERSR